MHQLSKVVEVFLNVDNSVAFVWAPIKFILLVCTQVTAAIDPARNGVLLHGKLGRQHMG